ncbi:MAG TPA: hypothetical protein VHN14_09810 [Kofleriaceae bacterium]|nr:hypothetical protein [Kofleriaceae bacterium]
MIAVVIFMPSSRVGPLQLTDEVVQSDTKVRGPSRHLGDVVRATATQGGPNRVIWVYHNDALILACPGTARCRSSDHSMTVEFTLNLLGEYVIVALASQSAIPAPKGTYDLDVAMLRDIAAPEIKPFSVH